ncbi:MAG: DNA repair protein RecN [Gallionellales bacterium RIFCSPLOWO2_12_FULL_59_22]|nr:MAG: DNA repair protein RecN [Gallionellales bacterium RIFCSPLOWO2_02_FULL_59_110]OGT04510.1 MAG: DNA repair protein RecN [Gallionellales bacterium RIFCSPLOWO2_02_58_13]OGT13515.1 MAG: DNA repair protein RecN [Gallionellales bacterium RIFCSPLOWO2_12_FULL_59_22]
MLKFLAIRDFVIVSSLELDFSSGFTALTGETGAGKSILIDALSLALGERGDAAMVRNGCERAEIAAEFDITALPHLQAWLAGQELEGDDGVCLLRRVLDANGRSRGFINGRSATLQQMREAGEQLLDIHGQHAHQSLLRPDAQRMLLDGYAGVAADAEKVAALYRDWQALRRRRISLSENAEAVAAERELLRFQRDELEGLGFNAADWQELQADYARLAYAASLLETAAFGIETLSEADGACLAQLNALMARLRDGLAHDASLGETLRMLESAQAELQEAVYALRHYQQRLDSDPQRLHEQEQRIQNVMDAARKHRVAPELLDEALRRIVARLAELGGDADLAALEQQEKFAQQSYLAASQKLSAARKKAVGKLTREITAAMQTLAMQGGSFAVALLPLAEGNACGLETVEFQVAANPGVPPRSLAKVASGGELSRIGLAIQVATSQVASVPTLIFDEVDSGIGGRVAEIVGHLLKELGKKYQVLCVTHLPQVAAAADHQWCVSKAVENGVALSRIAVLDGAQRVEEIARMLGGAKITDTTRKHAVEMLGVAA